nr:MAG TPA: hypothetical protein [Caudoviricetes sp.]
MSTIYNPYLNYGTAGMPMNQQIPTFQQQSPYPVQLPNNSVLQTTQDANNFQNFLSNLQSSLLNGNGNNNHNVQQPPLQQIPQQQPQSQQNNTNVMAMLSGMLQNPQNQEMLKNVINGLQNNNSNTGNEKDTNKTISKAEEVQVPEKSTKSDTTGFGQESIITMMLEMLKGQNKKENQTPEEIESKIFDIYAYKAMDTLITKLASASKPIDSKHIAQTAFDIAQEMITERKNRISNNDNFIKTNISSEKDLKPKFDELSDNTITKEAQEHIINNL